MVFVGVGGRVGLQSVIHVHLAKVGLGSALFRLSWIVHVFYLVGMFIFLLVVSN